MTVFQTKDGTLVSSFTAIATGDDSSDFHAADGTTTNSYTQGDSTFIKTDLSSVDRAQVTVEGQGGTVVAVTEARPATPADFNADDDFVDGSVVVTLTDISDGTELAAGDITDYQFAVTAYST